MVSWIISAIIAIPLLLGLSPSADRTSVFDVTSQSIFKAFTADSKITPNVPSENHSLPTRRVTATPKVSQSPFLDVAEPSAIASNVYVKCSSGVVEESGSLTNPYRTVADGYSAASSGDTLIIGACNYPETPTFSKALTIKNECGTAIIGEVGDAGPEDFVVTTSNVPLDDTGALYEEWNDIVDNSLRVAGEDPVGKWIGSYNVQDFSWPGLDGGPWNPVPSGLYEGEEVSGDYKQTLCGELHHFSVYDGGGDEWDWNNNIIPSARYAYILEYVKTLENIDLSKWSTCNGELNCLQAEITPDDNFHDFHWFNDDSPSPLEGETICTYGPWVQDCDKDSHGCKPEIHPSELMWWEEPSLMGFYYLLMVQDDSDRFSRVGYYEGGPADDLCWHPWSAYPRTATFKFAFRVNTLTTTPDELFIDIPESQNVNANLYDVTDGSDHTLTYNGLSLLTVHELLQDEYVQVGFKDLFRRTEAEGEVIYGYVTLTSSIGVDDSGGEGFLLLKLY